MAEVVARVEGPDSRGVIVVTWETLTATNTTGAPVQVSGYPDKSVQVVGTFGTGGVISLEGSNSPAPATATYVILTDHVDAAVSLGTGDGIAAIAQNPLWVKPVLTAGTGTIDLDVIMVCAPRQT